MDERPILTISTRIASRIIDAAASRGVDRALLCRSADLVLDDVRDVDGRIDQERYLKLWAAAVAATKDPAFPLAVAQAGSESHNLLRFICMSSENLGEAFRRASRYLRVLTDTVSWPLELRGERTVLTMLRHGEPDPSTCRAADEFGAAEIVALARLFSGVAWDPVEIHFTHGPPAEVAPYQAFFRAPLRFGQPRSEIHLATASLATPLVRADRATVAFFEPYMDKLLSENAGTRPLADEVRDLLADALRGEAPSLEDVAASLRMSGRTLRRRLQAEGTTFQTILDQARFDLAKQHITTKRLSFAEISFLLGFSEPSAFHRAFRRWTGTTPQAFARSQAVDLPPEAS